MIRLAVNIIALFFVVNIVPGISASGWGVLVTAAVIIGLLNAFLRPVLILLTLPISILSVGIFTLVINGFMFYLASMVVKGFMVESLWSAFLASIIFSVISFVLNIAFSPRLDMRLGPRSGEGRLKKDDDAIDVEGRTVD